MMVTYKTANDLLDTFSRIYPILVLDKSRKKTEIEAIKSQVNFKIIENIDSPKALYELFKENQGMDLFFDFEILAKNKRYTDILSGAVCSSPDSGMLWPIRYYAREFVFKGRVVLTTDIPLEELKKNKNIIEILRDTINL